MSTTGALERFKRAQDDPESGWTTALEELRGGRKASHWIWYVFPQLASLGRSSTARFYGIADLREARDYLGDAVLRERLHRVTEAVAEQLKRGVAVVELMGGETDSLKLVSSMTLFAHAAAALGAQGASAGEISGLGKLCAEVLAIAERQGLRRCAHTDAACKGRREA